MAEKVTIMKLKVDLQCCKCYKKVKKVLCKFPQIRDQEYDEKHNIVTITVVCCDPEKLRDKLCCKGCGVIKSIEIVEPPKQKPPSKPPTQKPPSKPKPEPEPVPEPCRCPPPAPPPEPCRCPPPPPPPEPCRCPPPPPPPEPCRCPPPLPPPEPCRCPPPPPAPEPCRCPPPPPPPEPEPCPYLIPIGVCCVPCYEGRPGGPCFHGPPPCYGRPVYDDYGCCRPCYMGRCEVHICEENTSACTIV